MKIDILSLFPQMFEGVMGESIMKRARENGSVSVKVTDFRTFTDDKHNRVDDYPYGGGEGMVLKPQPIFSAVDALLDAAGTAQPRIIMMTPQGKTFRQQDAEKLSREEHLIFLCGHYEGFDERIRQELVTDEYSIGDYVLTGGELPAMVMTDSIVRLLPGVLGNVASAEKDSFSDGLLEHPHYTRPADFNGHKVPDVLLSGNHQVIAEWRRQKSIERTLERRPELLADADLTEQEKLWVQEQLGKKK